MACLIPYQQAGVTQSPFALVLNHIGLPFAGDLMNFVVLTAILSAANSGLSSTRMLWSMANEHMMPQALSRTTHHGVPFIALVISMIGGLLALFSSVIAASTVYLVLVSVSGWRLCSFGWRLPFVS